MEIALSDRRTRDQIDEDFWRFHGLNPEVYELFDRFARELIRAGHRHGSANLIFERIRWETAIDPNGGEPVKLNNNYRSRYARLWENRNPRHRGFFRTRALNPVSSNATHVPEDERRRRA